MSGWSRTVNKTVPSFWPTEFNGLTETPMNQCSTTTTMNVRETMKIKSIYYRLTISKFWHRLFQSVISGENRVVLPGTCPWSRDASKSRYCFSPSYCPPVEQPLRVAIIRCFKGSKYVKTSIRQQSGSVRRINERTIQQKTRLVLRRAGWKLRLFLKMASCWRNFDKFCAFMFWVFVNCLWHQ